VEQGRKEERETYKKKERKKERRLLTHPKFTIFPSQMIVACHTCLQEVNFHSWASSYVK
jgi:hypothetical protein